jgi:hypothetical protein
MLNLEQFIPQAEEDASLLEPESLLRRIQVLDALDSLWGDADAGEHGAGAEFARMLGRAEVLKAKLEEANAAMYESIRDEIRSGAGREALLPWLQRAARVRDGGDPCPGLAFDASDEIASGVLQLREPEKRMALPSPEMVFYQPTPMRHILRFVELSTLSADDVLFDLGSGLGHVPMLASILTAAHCVGVELDAGSVECARECAESLGLGRVSFVRGDARETDSLEGTVFYLYTPFSGTILESVLCKLRRVSERKAIRIGTLGPCTVVVAREAWLTPLTVPDPEQITVFQSRP